MSLRDEVKDLNAGDYVEAWFRELAPDVDMGDGFFDLGGPTGEQYKLVGRLEKDENGTLSMPRPARQCVRQPRGEPGGNLLSIIKVVKSYAEQKK